MPTATMDMQAFANPVAPFQSLSVAPAPQIPVSGPTAGTINQQAATMPIRSLAEMGQRGVIGNTLAEGFNQAAATDRMEKLKADYIRFARNAKQSALTAYNGAPEVFKDPEVLTWLPNPDDIGWVDPKTGEFDWDKYTQHYAVGLQKYREFKAQMQLEKEKQQAISERSANRDKAQVARDEARARIEEAKLKVEQWRASIYQQGVEFGALKAIRDEASDQVEALDKAIRQYKADQEVAAMLRTGPDGKPDKYNANADPVLDEMVDQKNTAQEYSNAADKRYQEKLKLKVNTPTDQKKPDQPTETPEQRKARLQQILRGGAAK